MVEIIRDVIKESFRYRLLNKKVAENMEVKGAEFFDLVLVPYCIEQKDADFYEEVPVTKALMERYGITMEEIDGEITKNTKVSTMAIGASKDKISFFVISNEERSYGASSFLYSDFVKNTAEREGSDLFIFPSSVHEVLVSLPLEKEYALGMVRDVNKETVRPEERLSDNVYVYRHNTGKYELL